MIEAAAPKVSPLVLVADDDENMRLLMRESLEQVGFKVEAVEDGVEALSAFDRSAPDIVMLDVMMPKMDGFTACRQLRSRPTGKHVPVLMVTGLGDIESINRAYDAGATDFILKPIKWPTLGYHVRYMLRAARAMAELEKSNKVKDEFLGVMSHELRTPLNIIVGYTTLLKEDNLGEKNPEHHKALETIVRQSDELLGRVNSILEATKIESGASTVQIDELSLVDFFDNLKLRLVAPANKNIAMAWNYPSDLPAMRTDGEKLRHILRNLINNAIKFTDQGSVIILARYIPQVKQLEVQISDSGVGIPNESLPVIFEKFRQLDGSATRGHGGVGLGLRIVKMFTQMLGGTVAVESSPGKGSTFTLAFPLAPNSLERSLTAPNLST